MDSGRYTAKGEIAQGASMRLVRINRDANCKGEPLQGAAVLYG